MASYTPNYNLKKPADAESYDIADANGNMDIIDSALASLNGKLAWTQLNVTEATEFPLSTDYKEIWFEGTLSSGYRLGTMMAFIPNRTSRVDFGFYNNSSAYAGANLIISNQNKLTVSHPIFCGSATTYSSIVVYAR